MKNQEDEKGYLRRVFHERNIEIGNDEDGEKGGFVMAFLHYLCDMNAAPTWDNKFIEYQQTDSWGTATGLKRKITIRHDSESGKLTNYTLRAMFGIVQTFEERGKIRKPHDIDERIRRLSH